MIKLTRQRHHSVITSGLRGKRRKDKELKLLIGKRDNNLTFGSHFWKRAKKQLKAETHNKCAYCEADTAVVAHGDVEHFRPKSRYWWLAYCYDNYLYSCQICNQSFKGDLFTIRGITLPEPVVLPTETDAQLEARAGSLAPDPLKDAEGLPMATFLQQIQLENADLINPYMTDPAPFFKWVADETLKEVVLEAKNNSAEVKAMTNAAQTILGLNREELRKLRWREYRFLAELKNVLLSNAITDTALLDRIKALLKESVTDSARFAGMARYFVQEVWQLALD